MLPWEHRLLAVTLRYLEAMKVRRLEVVRRASAPVHDVLVLTLAAQFAVPVSDAQVVVHHALAVGAVFQHGVEERLTAKQEGKGREGGRNKIRRLHSFCSLCRYTKGMEQPQRVGIRTGSQ